MEFRTPLHITPSPSTRIDHKSPVLTVGSCFATVVGNKLRENKFKVTVNPFGVIFNPTSIFKLLTASAEDENYFKETFIQNSGIWYNFDFHSDFSASKKEQLESKIGDAVHHVHSLLKHSRVITLTFGTAFVYKLNLTGEIVANCHKVPAFNFEKQLLQPHDIVKGFEKAYLAIKYLNPHIKFILTVSPVRHIKDGLEANSLSKSILRVACHSMSQDFSDVEYFPSYEIVMDDLRDYRFYKEDMLHTSEVAENYIWEKFLQKYTGEETRKIIKDWTTLSKAIQHKAFHPKSEAHQKFLKETIAKVKGLSKIIDVQEELKVLEGRLV